MAVVVAVKTAERAFATDRVSEIDCLDQQYSLALE